MARKSKKKKAKRAKQAKRARRVKPPARAPASRVPKVWHIFHFGERYELPEDMRACRKGPLQFLRLFVTGANDNESHISMEQWAMLDLEDDTLILEAVFIRLQKHAARRSRKYRGYLLNEMYLPMTTAQISRVVKLDVSETAAAIKVLAKYNLIERVAMPDFDSVPDEPESEDRRQKSEGRGQKSEDGSQKTKSKTQPKTEADGAGGSAAKRAAPAASLDLDKLYDPECKKFAGEVFVKIFGKAPKAGVRVDHREMGAFASAWCRAQTAGLKPSQLTTLWNKSMKEAEKTGRVNRMGKTKKPGAVWMKIFNGRLLGMTPKKK